MSQSSEKTALVSLTNDDDIGTQRTARAESAMPHSDASGKTSVRAPRNTIISAAVVLAVICVIALLFGKSGSDDHGASVGAENSIPAHSSGRSIAAAETIYYFGGVFC